MLRLLYPLRTFLILSGRYDSEFDVMAADWVTMVSAEPYIVAVAISPKRYTYRLVEKYSEFVISVPNIDMLRDVWIAGTKSGPSKVKEMSVTFKRGKVVSAPVIKEALANLECKVIGSHTYGDHKLFVGEVVAYEYSEEVFQGDKPDVRAGFLLHVARNEFVSTAQQIIRAHGP